MITDIGHFMLMCIFHTQPILSLHAVSWSDTIINELAICLQWRQISPHAAPPMGVLTMGSMHARPFIHISGNFQCMCLQSHLHVVHFFSFGMLWYLKNLYSMLMILSRGGRALRSELKRAGTDTSFVAIFHQFIFLKENGYISVIKPQIKQIRTLRFLSCQAYCTLDHTKLQHNNYC